MTDYDTDQQAVDWARSKVENVIEKFRRFEQQSETPEQWRKMINILNYEFVGGVGCVIAAFDKRRPMITLAINNSNPPPPPGASKKSARSPLDAEPGSRWRDPETGTEWVATSTGYFAQTGGGQVVQKGILWPYGIPTDVSIIARLVPVPTHETVSTVEELDALPGKSVIRSADLFLRKGLVEGFWYVFGSGTTGTSKQVVESWSPSWIVVWRP